MHFPVFEVSDTLKLCLSCKEYYVYKTKCTLKSLYVI